MDTEEEPAQIKFWGRKSSCTCQRSNPWLSDHQASALPTELFWPRCSTFFYWPPDGWCIGPSRAPDVSRPPVQGTSPAAGSHPDSGWPEAGNAVTLTSMNNTTVGSHCVSRTHNSGISLCIHSTQQWDLTVYPEHTTVGSHCVSRTHNSRISLCI